MAAATALKTFLRLNSMEHNSLMFSNKFWILKNTAATPNP
jgi:hypothetical protein